MNVLIFQTLLLLLLAFLVGCILGCWLKRLFASEEVAAPARETKPEPAPSVAAAAPAVPAGAFEWTTSRGGEGVILEGMVPTITERNAILDDAKARFAGVDVDDRMTIGGKTPAGADWLSSAKFALGPIERLSSGDATLDGTSYSIRGVAASKRSYDAIRKALPAGLPAGLSLGTFSVDTPAPAKPKAAAKSKAPAKAKAKAAAPAEPELIAVETDRDIAGSQPKGYRTARGGQADDLKRIKGIGKVNEGKLNGFGIWHFDQIADWTKSEIDWVDDYIAFPGRIEREDWVGQAKVLARGGDTAFSKRVDKGEVSTSAGGPSRKPRTKN